MFENEIQEQKEVTVLGKTFASDQERRTYFRSELRKRLPELKKMEGFPLGEDDDIINLSDPPYYTACPNPWLNDFIKEWELQKKQKKKLRKEDFEVNQPYASDISVGKNNPIYMAHSYHTKVPHPAISKYLNYYTQPGDIILDGFAGTGMTGVAASLCSQGETKVAKQTNKLVSEYSRRYIGLDLSTIASFISYNYNNWIPSSEFKKSAEKLISDLKGQYEWLYSTAHKSSLRGTINYTIWSDVLICHNCGSEIIFWDAAIDSVSKKVTKEFECSSCKVLNTKSNALDATETQFDNISNISRNLKKRVPVLINYSYDGKRFEKTPDKNDIELIEKINSHELDSWMPLDKVIFGDEISRLKNERVEFIYDLFHKRTLIVLSELVKKSNSDNRYLLLLTAILQNASWMYRWRANGKGGTTSGTYYICSTPQENNVINQITRKVKDLTKAFKVLETSDSEGVSSTGSCTSLNVSSNSIDYIFTDPPFGSNLMYSELNFIWEPWLKVFTNNAQEAISNRYQNKSLFEYGELMMRSFKEYYRILKPGKWMTVEFSNTSAAVWNSIQNAINGSGFIIANVSSLDKKQGSFKAVTTPTAVKQDLVISCYKPSDEFKIIFNSNSSNEIGIWEFITEHLSHLPVHLKLGMSSTSIVERSPKILYDRLIAFYIQKKLPVPLDASTFQQGLREKFIQRDGMFFSNEQAIEYDKKKVQFPETFQLSLLVSSEQDGVIWLKNLLLDKALAYQDIQPLWMQALAGVRKGDAIPELAIILDENYLKDASGKWYIPDPENEADLEKERNKRLIKQFDIYKEIATKPKGKIKECRVDALRAGFKQCYQDKDYKTIVMVGDRIPNNLLMEDEVLLQFYDIASSRV